MKKQLFTKHSFVVMLITLVLTLGVQGIADAQRVTEGSGDHQNQVPSLPFNSPLVFTISDVTAANETPAGTGTLGDPPAPPTITATNLITITGTGVTINGVTISGKTTTTTTTLNQPKVYSPAVTTTTHSPAAERTALSTGLSTYNNANTTLKVGSNTITVRLTAGGTANSNATVVVASGGTTLKTFTFYVAATPAPGGTFNPASPSNAGVYTNTIASSVEGEISFATVAGAANMLADFSILSGSGGLYFDADDRDRNRSKRNQTVGINGTANTAAIRFRPSGTGVTVIQAAIRGTNQRAYRTLFSNFPNLIKVDDVAGRTGVIGTRLPDSFVVEVRDGPTGRGIPNQTVRFTVSFSGGGNSNLPHQAATVTMPATATMLTSTADSTKTVASTAASTDASITLDLQTDSTGKAGVYLTFGVDVATTPPTPRTDVGTYTLMAQLTDTPPGNTPTIWDTETFTAQSVGETTEAIIEIASGDNQRVDTVTGAPDEQLVVRVLNRNRQIVRGEPVTFRATVGTLTGDAARVPSGGTATGQFVTQTTDEFGQAAVAFVIGETSGNAEVRAVINPATQHEQGVTFTVNGRGSTGAGTGTGTGAGTGTGTGAGTGTVTASVPSTVSGTAGGTATLTVRAPATARVTIGSTGDTFPIGNASPGVFVGSGSSRLTLPSTAQTYTLTVFVDGTQYPVSVVVNPAASQTGSVRVGIQPGSGAPGTQATVTVTATDSNNQPANVSVTLSITSGGGTFANGTTSTTVSTGTTGTGTATLTRGSTPGSNYFITATPPSGYTFQSVLTSGERLTVAGTQPPPAGDTSVPRAAGEAAAIDVYDGDGQRGVLNARLTEMLIVEVTDANGDPVSGERVTFRTTIGSGRFSPARPRTNGNGRAQAWFTPTSSGTIRVAASIAGVSARAVFNITTGAPPASVTKVSGDNQSGSPNDALANPFVVEVKNEDGETIEGVPVVFSVTAGGGSLSETSATTDRNGRAETTLTLGSQAGINSVEASVSGVDPVTFSTSIDAKILVAAANRPVMYWIDGGALYRLAGAKEAKIAESVNGAAIGGGKLYWTAATGNRGGTIHSANLDGSGATQLASIFAVPMGIAVDTAGSKLYWTNTGGRIQNANLNGSGIKNVVQNLSDPTDIVVSNGFIYWTEGGNTIKRVNISGQKTVKDVAANLDTVGGLAVGGGKVYWTEATGVSAGTINGANLNGTNFETLATIRSAPMGIAVDTAGSKLYWTNARGRVQSGTLSGGMIRNVVEGLMSPSTLVIGGANAAEAVTQQPGQPAKTPAKKDNSAFDVNGDGTVDNVDASLVAGAMNTTNAKYDVNGDGTVNFLDLLLVFDNRDSGAAGAPTVVGMQMTAAQVDVLQEQINLLIATGDRSPAAMRTLIYLQQLIATARPEKTQLLANYPNPFNPETWIPYELATDTNVKITIYNTQGVVIRTLALGHQSAGYYTGRDQAAYWDGRNAFGEQVASGIYFYQFETDTMSAMRKMVILK